jgi:hypothetical protein
MSIEHFSFVKKRLQRLGSWVLRQASGTSVPDATSGFRAYNREAALSLVVVSTFTYTLESLIQAGKSFVAIGHVPIKTNEKMRESRLFGSMWQYVRRNVVAMFRIYAGYEPLISSSIADAVNLGKGPAAITASLFLRHFAGDVPWAHLDVASVGDVPEDRHEWTKGPSGFGARALLAWLGSDEPLAGVGRDAKRSGKGAR